MPQHNSDSQREVLMSITLMLTGMGIPHGTDPDALINSYMMVIDGIRTDCVIDTCRAFQAGKVSDYKRGRAPPTDIFATECRSLASARTATEHSKAKRAIEQDKPRQRTEQEREVMMVRFALLQSALKGDQRAQEALVPFGWRVIK